MNKSELKNKEVLARERIKKMVEEIGNIGDPYKTVLSGAELESIKNLDSLRKIKLQHLSEEDWLKFTEAFTYDTNAIEGSTVEKREVEDILENNEWPDKSKWEISETFGVSEAVKYIRTTKIHISVRLIKDLHMVVFKNSKPFAGKFRKMGEEVAVIDAYGKVIHRGAPSTKVTSLLKELLKWYKNNKRKYPPLVLAAVVHNQFENIHPFRDGNGRVGRLLLINILLKHNLPPVNIELKNRVEYYASLQSYENDGNIRPTLDLILKEYKKLSNVLKR
ncbi:MAG: Fic family protein [Candidatus Micrarchaeaceae archaeon]